MYYIVTSDKTFERAATDLAQVAREAEETTIAVVEAAR